MNIRARLSRLERRVRSLRPAVSFLFDEGVDRVRSNLHTGTLTDDEAGDLLDDPPAPLTFAIWLPSYETPGRATTWEDLQAENAMTEDELTSSPLGPDDGPVVRDPWEDVDMDAARALVREAMGRAVSGRSMDGLDFSALTVEARGAKSACASEGEPTWAPPPLRRSAAPYVSG